MVYYQEHPGADENRDRMHTHDAVWSRYMRGDGIGVVEACASDDFVISSVVS
ncbi:hypothetical protein [Methanothrix sp.]|uniref:hypothetical protein n=1 Tax=Methanothrix sp. TaxID=90426 RepID=UPI003C709C94